MKDLSGKTKIEIWLSTWAWWMTKCGTRICNSDGSIHSLMQC